MTLPRLVAKSLVKEDFRTDTDISKKAELEKGKLVA
jgi:hypothetical protein